MSAISLDGSALAKKIAQSLAPRILAVRKARGRPPRLAVVSAGEAPAAGSYLHSQVKACRAAQIEADVHSLPGRASLAETIQLMLTLGRDAAVDAIIVDLPLPRHIDAAAIIEALAPSKDAEGVTAANYGRLFMAKTYAEISTRAVIAPPTALAVVELLRETHVPLAGKRAAVLGRSNIVGKPAAHLIGALNATATLCHSGTRDIEGEVRRADIVVAALGKPRFVKGSWLKKDAIVIDVGVNPDGKSLCGDVDFKEACATASYITPVPGGVGPVTTAMLLANAVTLAEGHVKRKD